MWKRLSNKLLCQLKNIHSYKSCARDVSNIRFSHFRTTIQQNSLGRFKWIHRLLQFSSIWFLSWNEKPNNQITLIPHRKIWSTILLTGIDNINFGQVIRLYSQWEYCIQNRHLNGRQYSIHILCLDSISMLVALYPKSVYHNFHVVHMNRTRLVRETTHRHKHTAPSTKSLTNFAYLIVLL